MAVVSHESQETATGDTSMRKFSLAIFGILSLFFVNAQEAAEPPEPAQEPAKEKQAVNQQKRLRDQTLSELDKKNQRAREAGDIAAKFKKSYTIQNPEIRITELLFLRRLLGGFGWFGPVSIQCGPAQCS